MQFFCVVLKSVVNGASHGRGHNSRMDLCDGKGTEVKEQGELQNVLVRY
jgi:hypothetical protein